MYTKSLDWWHTIHFIVGLVIGYLFELDLLQFIIIVFIWEVSEALIKRYYDIFNIPFGKKSRFETPLNVLFDVIFTLAGWLVATNFL